jgi:NADPH2:quinone reductase
VRAAVINAVDGPFELVDLPDPVGGDGKALVRVRAAGINFADVLVRRGRYPQMPELPAVLGSEIAGELEDGTRVMAITSGAGGYAELAAVDREQLVPLPDQASFA